MNYLLDTSALKWAYIDKTKHTRRLRTVISRAKGRVFVAEISVLEIVNALGHHVRGNRMTVRQFSKADLRFLKDLAAKRIVAKQLPSGEMKACRELLALVGVAERRNLGTQDAMVAYTARRLALDTSVPTRLLTSDKTLAAIVNDLDAFKSLVTAEYLKPA